MKMGSAKNSKQAQNLVVGRGAPRALGGNFFLARPKACTAGRGDSSRRARAMCLGLSGDNEHDNNN